MQNIVVIYYTTYHCLILIPNIVSLGWYYLDLKNMKWMVVYQSMVKTYKTAFANVFLTVPKYRFWTFLLDVLPLKNPLWKDFDLKELGNCILWIICLWSLFCSVQVYKTRFSSFFVLLFRVSVSLAFSV